MKTASMNKVRRMSDFYPRTDILSVEEGLLLRPLFDERGLIPCITQHVTTNEVLMLGWMNREAFDLTISTGHGHYFSRARKGLWRKGERSGQTQIVRRILIDDDQDCLLILVDLPGGASCHVGYRSCFFRELNWYDHQTDFSLRMLESSKVYAPEQFYAGQVNSLAT
jgi:phosphoribosyl-AMP cyclohydrolase